MHITSTHKKLLEISQLNEGISQREALLDLDMSSATLASRASEMERLGIKVRRVQRKNPTPASKYPRYFFSDPNNVSGTQEVVSV